MWEQEGNFEHRLVSSTIFTVVDSVTELAIINHCKPNRTLVGVAVEAALAILSHAPTLVRLNKCTKFRLDMAVATSGVTTLLAYIETISTTQSRSVEAHQRH